MTQAAKVAEIFSAAGEAFTKLGNLAKSLQPASTQDGGKWEDEEIDMLRKAISQFGNDLEKISEKIKTKSAIQIKNTLKQKAAQNLNVTPTVRSKDIANTQIQNIAVKTNTRGATGPSIFPKTTLQSNTAKTPVMGLAGQNTSNIAVRPTVMSIQGQNIVVKSTIVTVPEQQQHFNVRPSHMVASVQNLAMKPSGIITPTSLISSQLNKSPMKVHNISRTIAQKAKMDAISVSGMMSLADVQNVTKKVKLDSSNVNILASTLLNQKPMVRAQTSGISGVVSSQGFQVIMPSSAKNMYPIAVRPTGIVQDVADANTTAQYSTTTGNIDMNSI